MTAIHFPDIEASSPDGRFRLEARSPYNLPRRHPDRKVSPTQSIWPDAFQTDFRLTLYKNDVARWSVEEGALSEPVVHSGQTPAGKPWSRQETDHERDHPRELFVSDSGACVVRTHGTSAARLMALSASTGARTILLDLLREVFVGPWAQHANWTTAGPFWEHEGERGYFVAIEGREHFCLRMSWGQRVLLDLVLEGRAEEAEHAAALDRFETREPPAKPRRQHRPRQ